MSHYFVRVEDAKDVRRQLLESSKMCIHTIKQEHRVMEIRKHKHAIMQHLRDELKELTFLLSSLEKDLPVLTKKELLEVNPAAFRAGPSSHQASSARGKVKDLGKIDRLEHSLKLIEKRLDRL